MTKNRSYKNEEIYEVQVFIGTTCNAVIAANDWSVLHRSSTDNCDCGEVLIHINRMMRQRHWVSTNFLKQAAHMGRRLVLMEKQGKFNEEWLAQQPIRFIDRMSQPHLRKEAEFRLRLRKGEATDKDLSPNQKALLKELAKLPLFDD